MARLTRQLAAIEARLPDSAPPDGLTLAWPRKLSGFDVRQLALTFAPEP
jgi:hypothetical protein